ncbi:hypothetical protein C8A05DRAFT_39696, partial [Staphylotrichum tortipilum]
MDDLSRMSDVDAEGDVVVTEAVIDDHRGPGDLQTRDLFRSPAPKSRSFSDGGGTPKKLLLSPSPHIVEVNRRQSQDDIAIRDKDHEPRENKAAPAAIAANNLSNPPNIPSTPVRTAFFPARGLSLQMPQQPDAAPPATAITSQPGSVRPTAAAAPPSPKLDQLPHQHQHTHSPYASPTHILPRRSRGLDFSRAATSLHHSTLADQASPDSSPTIGSRAMNIPGRRPAADYHVAGADHTSTSLWSMMGNHERMHISSSVGSTSHAISDLSSSSDDDDYMDEDMEDAYVTTPQVQKMGNPAAAAAAGVMGAPWAPGSPAVNNLLSFQQRQRQRRLPKKKPRGPLGLGFHSPAAPTVMSRSPPNHLIGPNDMSPHARRESISWAANQLHISGNESDDNHNRHLDGIDSPSRPSIVRRAVTRRGNLLPKTKGFARIRAALAEESAPVESEFRREAEVVRQVRESDMDLEPRYPLPQSAPSTALSSPNLATHDGLDEITDDLMMIEPGPNALGLSGSFKQQAMKNSKGKVFWDTFSDTSSQGAAPRVTPPPPSFGIARTNSTSFNNLDDMSMGSPSASSNGGASQSNPFILPSGGNGGGASGSGHGTPLGPPAYPAVTNPCIAAVPAPIGVGVGVPIPGVPPTAAEITRRINSKRRRDDDLDPVSIKRRAVSPGMSVHNSPVMQSPLQRDAMPWGTNTTGGGGGNG